MKNVQQEVTAIQRLWCRWFVASSFIVLTLFAPFVFAANSVIGKVVYVDGKAVAQASKTEQKTLMLGEKRVLEYGDEIFVRNQLKTFEGGTLKISFVDGAEITLRPKTGIYIKKYSHKEAQIEILEGGIRAVTGEVARRNPDLYQVITPDGLVTAQKKGSDFSVRICGQDCDIENKNMAGPKIKTQLPVIAKVVAVQGEVIVGRKYKRRLGVGYPLYRTEHLVSAENSFAQLQFVDGSSVTVQANSAFDISDYKYNETGKEDRSVFKLLKGGLRFVTGLISKNNREAFSLHTSAATIGVWGTDFTVNCVGDCSSGGIVSHVIEGSIDQRNESGSSVLESGSYGVISSQQSSPIVTTTAPVIFDNNIAPPPSKARVNTLSLFTSGAETVEPGTHVSVKEGQVEVAGSAGESVVVDANLSVAVSKSGNVSGAGSVNNFQMLDPVSITPSALVSAPATSINTIVIGVSAGSTNMNSAAGSSAVTTIVIQEQTIASPYNR